MEHTYNEIGTTIGVRGAGTTGVGAGGTYAYIETIAPLVLNIK